MFYMGKKLSNVSCVSAGKSIARLIGALLSHLQEELRSEGNLLFLHVALTRVATFSK